MKGIIDRLKGHKLYHLRERVSAGDEIALNQLYKDYSKFIYWQIMEYVDDKDTGEDILQEVFIKLYRLEPRNLPKVGATSWIVQVARNTAITHMQKKSNQSIGYRGEDFSIIDTTTPADISIEDQIVNSMYIKDILVSIDEATQKILLKRHDGFTFEEIAQQLEMKPSTVRSKYNRALKKLKIVGNKNE